MEQGNHKLVELLITNRHGLMIFANLYILYRFDTLLLDSLHAVRRSPLCSNACAHKSFCACVQKPSWGRGTLLMDSDHTNELGILFSSEFVQGTLFTAPDGHCYAGKSRVCEG